MDSKTVRKEDALAEYIESREYGDIIHKQDIERVTGFSYGSGRSYRTIAKAKKILEHHGKAIVSLGSGDYRIIYPGDYTREYANEVKKASNRLKKGKRLLDGAPTTDMTEEELQSYNQVYDFNARLSASFSGSVTEVRKLVGKKHPLEAALTEPQKP